MMSVFQYRVLGHTQWVWPAFAAGVLMLILALHAAAPMWVWALILPCLAICVLQTALRPIYGIRLSPARLEVFDGFHEQVVQIEQVAYLQIVGAKAWIIMRSGIQIALPNRALPNPLALIGEMTARNIPVRQT